MCVGTPRIYSTVSYDCPPKCKMTFAFSKLVFISTRRDCFILKHVYSKTGWFLYRYTGVRGWCWHSSAAIYHGGANCKSSFLRVNRLKSFSNKIMMFRREHFQSFVSFPRLYSVDGNDYWRASMPTGDDGSDPEVNYDTRSCKKYCIALLSHKMTRN